MPLSLADVLAAQSGAPGPVYEGGPDANVTLGGVLSALGLGGPSWLERAGKQSDTDWAAYQRGGVPELMADTQGTQDLAGGFGGTTTPAKGIRAYHGSPYDFEKFDISKIGTGEGAQAYGHGLYFAENPATAHEYRKALSDTVYFSKADHGRLADTAAKYIERYGSQGEALRAVDLELANMPQNATARGSFEQLKDALVSGTPGRMYEVNINAEPGQFLNWDKPLVEQPPSVRDAYTQAVMGKAASDPLVRELFGASGAAPNEYLGLFERSKGSQAYNTLGSQSGMAGSDASRYATQRLDEAGIPGIRYLDQGSRNAPFTGNWRMTPPNQAAGIPGNWEQVKPTSNYVVFNPEIVDILKKYGLAGLTMGGVLSAAGQPPAPTQ